jgi:uncharacterized protein HemY
LIAIIYKSNSQFRAVLARVEGLEGDLRRAEVRYQTAEANVRISNGRWQVAEDNFHRAEAHFANVRTCV